MLDFDDCIYEEIEQKDLLTNFSQEDLPIYEKAVAIFNDDSLFISNEAYDIYGNRLRDDYSLRTKKCKDRSEFWKLFRNIKNLSAKYKTAFAKGR